MCLILFKLLSITSRMFDEALMDLYEHLTGNSRNINVSIHEKRNTPYTMKDLNPTNLEELVTVSGVVVKVSENMPDMIEMYLRKR